MTPELVFRDPYMLDFLGLAHIPDMKVLQAQLHRAMELARERATHTLVPQPPAITKATKRTPKSVQNLSS